MARPTATMARPARLSTLPIEEITDSEPGDQDTGSWDFTQEAMIERCQKNPQRLFESIDLTIKQRDQYLKEKDQLQAENERRTGEGTGR